MRDSNKQFPMALRPVEQQLDLHFSNLEKTPFMDSNVDIFERHLSNLEATYGLKAVADFAALRYGEAARKFMKLRKAA